MSLKGLLFLWRSRQPSPGAYWTINSCQGSWPLQRFRTWTWAMNHAGTFSLRVVFLSWCPSHLFSPKFSYGHELILELTLPSVWDGQNESCVRLSFFIDPAWHPFSAVTPVWCCSHLLGGVPPANWPYFHFHPITLSFLSVLSWTATWPQVFVFSAVFLAWNICSGIWIVALYFF